MDESAKFRVTVEVKSATRNDVALKFQFLSKNSALYELLYSLYKSFLHNERSAD